MGLFNDSKFTEVAFDFLIEVCSLCFEFFDFSHYGLDVDRLFFLECVNIARDIEIIVIIGNLLESSAMAIFLDFLAVTVGFDNLADVFFPEFVLRFDFLKLNG